MKIKLKNKEEMLLDEFNSPIEKPEDRILKRWKRLGYVKDDANLAVLLQNAMDYCKNPSKITKTTFEELKTILDVTKGVWDNLSCKNYIGISAMLEPISQVGYLKFRLIEENEIALTIEKSTVLADSYLTFKEQGIRKDSIVEWAKEIDNLIIDTLLNSATSVAWIKKQEDEQFNWKSFNKCSLLLRGGSDFILTNKNGLEVLKRDLGDIPGESFWSKIHINESVGDYIVLGKNTQYSHSVVFCPNILILHRGRWQCRCAITTIPERTEISTIKIAFGE